MNNKDPMMIALVVLLGFLSMLYLGTLAITWIKTKKDDHRVNIRGLFLPQGSIRGLIAFSLIGSFVVFVFFGQTSLLNVAAESEALSRSAAIDLYEKILTIFGTLTASVTGFYFGGRYAQNLNEPEPTSRPNENEENEPNQVTE